ncbi:DUF1481 domain-containing protein [Shewanella sp. 10N.286.48.B5]|uniref:DUF1481 domain-containing protein n=1 Tax=Shewanella sp. 10N.286.48.B5 TaxID=1880834 RepID=UPI0039A682E5
MRFNQSGEAVYQQYRLDGKVLPLQSVQLDRFKQEAHLPPTLLRSKMMQGLELLQGYWNGKDVSDLFWSAIY